MRLYLLPVMGMCFAVDGLLMMASARLTDQQVGPSVALAASLEAVCGGACLLPGWSFLGSLPARILCLASSSWIAFGRGTKAVKSAWVYGLLNVAAGGLALGSESGEKERMLAVAAVFGLCLLILIFRQRPGGTVPVVLRFGGREERLTALRDTGNGLRDPVTGDGVLVVGAESAKRLCGLERQQLSDPLGTVQARLLPGLRLIPYRTVGNTGFLLALRMEHVQIGGRVRSTLVAFAPHGLDGNGAYQALTGGMV